MLKLQRQCATIQITVTNSNGVMMFDQSTSAEATGHLEYMLREALVNERRIVEGEIANSFHDRIAQLQKEIRELKGQKSSVFGGHLRDKREALPSHTVDAEFTEVPKTIALPPPKGGMYDA